MLKTKKTKFLLVLALVFTMLLPYASPVMAATIPVKEDVVLKQSDLDGQSIKITSSNVFKSSSSSTTPKCYSYASPNLAQAIMYQVVVASDNGPVNYDNVLYCIDASKTLPAEGSSENYANIGNFFELSAATLGKSTQNGGYNVSGMGSNDANANQRVYNELCWILQNMYVESEADSLDAFLNKVYADQIATKPTMFNDQTDTEEQFIDFVKRYLKQEDIHMLQQAAIWYFTNSTGTNSITGVTTDSTIETQYPNYGYKPAAANQGFNSTNVKTAYTLPTTMRTTSGTPISSTNTGRTFDATEQLIYSMLYSYLIVNAKKATGITPTVTNPKFDANTTPTFSVETIDNDSFYKFGPFKIDNINNANVDLQITDYTNTNQAITTYKVLEPTADQNAYNLISENSITYSGVAGKTFYVYVPASEDITGINIKMIYHDANTNVTFWYKEGKQPVVLVTRTPEEGPRKGVPIKKYDLALRKYIKAIDGEELTGDKSRAPKVDATGLIGNANNTAIYKHSKTPVEISKDSKITYGLIVYNEGDIDAVVNEIRDFIPEDMELAEESIAAGWTVENGIAKLTITDGTLQAKQDGSIRDGKDSLSGGLSVVKKEITLKIKDSAKASITSEKILTNIAEISDTNGNSIDSNGNVTDNIDIDSTPKDFNKNDISDLSTYNGSGEIAPGYIGGIEDDDDFDKVKIKVDKPVIDLALQKFITSINGTKLTGENSREPKVNTQRLKDYLAGTSNVSDATYTTKKSAIKVQKGDIVTYTIRVYNEGPIDAYAQQITDYIPEGLGYLVSYEPNTIWSIEQLTEGTTIPLTKIDNAVENLKKIDANIDPNHVTVVKGALTLNTDKLSHEKEKANSPSVLKAFDGGNSLSYKDVEVTCVVLADEVKDNNLKNIAEITGHAIVNEDGTVTTLPNEPGNDRDSTPNNVKTKNGEDDDDYENLTMEEDKVYDLALQKFITAVDEKAVTDREPTVTVENGKVKYNHSTQALPVANGQLIEYTIRVYNEGNVDTVATEIADDLPKGLEFVANNKTNQENGWKLYDKDGNETTNTSLAKTVRSSKLDGAENAIEGFDPTKDSKPKSKDLKIVFRVNETVLDKTKDTEARTIINTAEITKETDKNGTDVTDQDSTPNNWKDGEDDIDKERIYVKFFDLELEKKLVKVIVTENGRVTEYDLNDDTLFKVELNKKKLNSTVVKFVYEITVYNKGEIDGYAKEIKDYIPEGLEFVEDDNTGWYSVGTNVVATDALAQTLLVANGGSASTNITLKWVNSTENMGKKINVAEISKDENDFDTPDIDSVPDNQVPDEDDIDDAPVILGISTGAEQSYTGLIVAVAVIMTTGIVLIKKYVL